MTASELRTPANWNLAFSTCGCSSAGFAREAEPVRIAAKIAVRRIGRVAMKAPPCALELNIMFNWQTLSADIAPLQAGGGANDEIRNSKSESMTKAPMTKGVGSTGRAVREG